VLPAAKFFSSTAALVGAAAAAAAAAQSHTSKLMFSPSLSQSSHSTSHWHCLASSCKFCFSGALSCKQHKRGTEHGQPCVNFKEGRMEKDTMNLLVLQLPTRDVEQLPR
jgi:hypothetical protein